MKDEEVCERFMVSMEIIREYDDLMQNTSGEYDDEALHCMSTIMSLHGLDFSTDEVRTYMEIVSNGDKSRAEQLCTILGNKRREALDEIHAKEEQISRIDYLTYEIEHSSNRDLRSE